LALKTLTSATLYSSLLDTDVIERFCMSFDVNLFQINTLLTAIRS